MKEVDRTVFAEQLELLGDTHGARITPGRIQGYWQALEGHERRTVLEAINHWIRGKKFPSPEDLDRTCQDYANSRLKKNGTGEPDSKTRRKPGPREAAVVRDFLRALMNALAKGEVKEFKQSFLALALRKAEEAERQDREEAEGKRRAA
jgi:hypothetical protein